MRGCRVVPLFLALCHGAEAFLAGTGTRCRRSALSVASTELSVDEEKRLQQKELLLGILNPKPIVDPVLADPVTKKPLVLMPKSGTYFGTFGDASRARRTTFEMKTSTTDESSSNTYIGSSATYFNLLEPVSEETDEGSDEAASPRQQRRDRLVRTVTPFIPPPLRSALATAGVLVSTNYVPMRDLFTSPAVSFAYERGWRQNFRGAGFPGEDEEARMALDYFEPSLVANREDAVLVDMSCATGLFTRRFAKMRQQKFPNQSVRVLGCDYSASMLQEARRRIQADRELRRQSQLDLVQCDVGQIPMQSNSIAALHAGAAMHCWPDLPAAASEIYRVLKPGGRYFATTFLSSWFGVLQNSEGGATGPSRQAFQYFESVDQLRELMVEHGGFEPHNVHIEVLAPSCVVIRCEK